MASYQVVADLQQIALDHQRRYAPDATWNSEAYSRLFRIALKGHWQLKSIWYQDIITAQIAEECFVPSVTTNPMKSKLVDYAIIIDPLIDPLDRIVLKPNKVWHLGIESMNLNAAKESGSCRRAVIFHIPCEHPPFFWYPMSNSWWFEIDASLNERKGKP